MLLKHKLHIKTQTWKKKKKTENKGKGINCSKNLRKKRKILLSILSASDFFYFLCAITQSLAACNFFFPFPINIIYIYLSIRGKIYRKSSLARTAVSTGKAPKKLRLPGTCFLKSWWIFFALSFLQIHLPIHVLFYIGKTKKGERIFRATAGGIPNKDGNFQL